MTGFVALIGDPVAHSISPAMQRAGFQAAGLDLEYVAVRVGPDELPAALARLRERAVGLNVTTPLKEAVVPLLDEVRPAALRAGSANTVSFAGARAVGDSTDGEGFLAALRRVEPDPSGLRRAVILGTGGAARAVAAALAGLRVGVTIVGRNGPNGERLAADLPGVAFVRFDHAGPPDPAVLGPIGRADLVVNATPLGGPAAPGLDPVPSAARLGTATIVFDLVYRPRRTPLVRRAASVGCRVVEGVEMLIEQGTRSFGVWTGLDAPADVMRAAAYRALDRAAPVPAERR